MAGRCPPLLTALSDLYHLPCLITYHCYDCILRLFLDDEAIWFIVIHLSCHRLFPSQRETYSFPAYSFKGVLLTFEKHIAGPFVIGWFFLLQFRANQLRRDLASSKLTVASQGKPFS